MSKHRWTFRIAVALIALSIVSGPALAQQDPNTVAPIVDASIQQFLPQVAFDITSYSTSLLYCIDAGNQPGTADFIMNNSAFPALSDDNPSYLVVHPLSDDPAITQQQLDDFRASLDALANIGACLARVDWVSPTAGAFTTYAIVENDALTFETMQLLVPTPWPMTGPAPTSSFSSSSTAPEQCPQETEAARDPVAAGFGQYEVSNSSGPEIFRNGWGVNCLRFNCTATADCQGGTVIGCTGTHEAMGLCFGWEASGSVASETVVGNCCRVTCNFGYASGFKSVKVGADGITIEVTGILGTSGTFSRTVKACCNGGECEPQPRQH